MSEYIISALVFGLTAGFKPGPLGIVIIQQTLEHGLKHGIRASLAPLITDGPIILGSLLLIVQIDDFTHLIVVLSVIGGLYLLWLSSKILGMRTIEPSRSPSDPASLATAIRVNFLNPNPYLFWFTVGGSYIALGTAMESTAFIVVTLATLVSSNIAVAWIASHFRDWLNSTAYLWLLRLLGSLLAVFGVLLLIKGLNTF